MLRDLNKAFVGFTDVRTNNCYCSKRKWYSKFETTVTTSRGRFPSLLNFLPLSARKKLAQRFEKIEEINELIKFNGDC